MPGLALDLLDPAVRDDPYPSYRACQDETPVHACPGWGWLVFRHADVMAALHEPRLSAAGAVEALFETLPAALQHELTPLRRHLSLWIGNRCPVEHGELAARLRPPFHNRAVQPLRPMCAEVAGSLLDGAASRGVFDVVAEFAQPLPAQVIARVLGADPADRDRFQGWSETLTEFLGFGLMDPAVQQRAQRTVLDMTARLGATLDARAAVPGDDLLSRGAEWIARGEMSRDAFLSNCVLLLFAGHETTAIAIANTLRLLLQDERARDRAAADEAFLSAAVQEAVRLESPVQMIRRRADADLELGGTHIRQGDFVWLMLGAANRDPRVFDEPDRFLPGRPDGRHLAFGHGPHYCLGAALSLVEAEEAVRAFLTSMPSASLEETKPEWLLNPATRSLRRLPVVPSPAGR